MNTFALADLPEILRNNSYPGRGIAVGLMPDGKTALMVYFIMGRSASSRNRQFYVEEDQLRIRLFDQTAAGDTSLILYHPTASYRDRLILTNGDQTDSILSGLRAGMGMRQALKIRRFEEDPPHYTPRISALLNLKRSGPKLQMSILRAGDQAGTLCDRLFYEYLLQPGEGRFLHTYQGDGDPLPAFTGEPIRLRVPEDAEAFACQIWESLDTDNKVALMVRTIDLAIRRSQFFIYNRHEEA